MKKTTTTTLAAVSTITPTIKGTQVGSLRHIEIEMRLEKK